MESIQLEASIDALIQRLHAAKTQIRSTQHPKELADLAMLALQVYDDLVAYRRTNGLTEHGENHR